MVQRLLLALVVTFFGFFSNCSGFHRPPGLVNETTEAPQSFHCPPKIIRVQFDSAFTPRERFLAISALSKINLLNVFPLAVEDHPDLLVRHWRNFRCVEGEHREQTLGFYTNFQNSVWIAPGCIDSDREYQTVVIHEIGHWLGMRHICRANRRTTDGCSPVGLGIAVLNPYLDSLNTPDVSSLDRIEYNRACWIRQGMP